MPTQAKREKDRAVSTGTTLKVTHHNTADAAAEDALPSAAAELGRRGGKARAAKLSRKQRTEIARKAAKARWTS